MTGFNDMTDETLVRLAKAGDESAYNEIFERYKGIVKIKAGDFFIAGASPEDTIQEGMIGLFHAVIDYDEDKGVAFGAFARLCIERRIMTAIRNAAGRKNSPLNESLSILDGSIDDSELPQDNPEEILVKRESARHIETLLRKSLSKMETKVFELLLQDRTYIEISEILGISSKSADNAIQRIKKKMKNIKNEANGLT